MSAPNIHTELGQKRDSFVRELESAFTELGREYVRTGPVEYGACPNATARQMDKVRKIRQQIADLDTAMREVYIITHPAERRSENPQ